LKKVVFTGLLHADAVREAYSAADVFLLPSLHENFGLSVAEAMAAGCPVIISDQVHIAPAILTAGAGLVGPPSVEAFSGMLEKLLRDKTLRKRMGENGRDLVFREYTWEKVAGDLTAVYEDILGGSRNSPAWNGCV
jgi:glycosyltransferase involved in cell wall biosynthesis